MKTRNILLLSILFLAACFLSACTSPVESIVGEYSFKISGTVTQDSWREVALTDEMGVMEIIHLKDNEFLLTFNTINGSAYTTQATLNGDILDINPFSRTVVISYQTEDSDIFGGLIEHTNIEYYQTEVYSSATMYGNTIEFKMQYSGKELAGTRKIVGNNIIMLAKKN